MNKHRQLNFKKLLKHQLIHLLESSIITEFDLLKALQFQKQNKMHCHDCVMIGFKLNISLKEVK